MALQRLPSRAQRRGSAGHRARPDHCEALRRVARRTHSTRKRNRSGHNRHGVSAPLSGERSVTAKKILVIEDDPEMRRNVRTILRLEGFDAVAAENGRRGVELARQQRPDLILCDVMMPELDGYGVLREVHNDPATMNIPFIFLTAKGEKTDVRSGMNLGA